MKYEEAASTADWRITMVEKELRIHRCCFTGHRPEKLQTEERIIKAELEHEIDAALSEGFRTFISGMARGVDLWAAEIVLEKRRESSAIKLIAASPYCGFEERRSGDWRQMYRNVLNKADLVRYICDGYSRTCFHTRNEWMVNHCARVIAVYNGEAGGTRNTIEYANRMKVPVVTIRP